MFKRFIAFLLMVLILAPLPAGAIKYKGDLESNESITFPEQGSTPANPAATKHKLYFKDDGAAYSLDSSGKENPVAGTGFKNKIINGNFDLWQRGPSFTASGAYMADRWKQNHNNGAGNATYTRQAFTLGQSDVPGEPKYYLRVVTTVAATGISSVLRYRIEDVRTLAGQTATLSFWAKVGTTKTFNVVVAQNFGTGGSPSAGVAALASAQSIGTTWTRYIYTFSFPSISGKTLGTDGNDYLEILIQETVSLSTFTLEVAQFQLEKGSVATDFEQWPFPVELALAQRYYQKTFPLGTTPAQNAGVADALCYSALLAGVNKNNLNWYLKTPMRTDPTIIYYNPSAVNNKFRNTPDAGDSGVPTTDVLSPNYVFIRNPQAATDAVGEQICIHATADAEL